MTEPGGHQTQLCTKWRVWIRSIHSLTYSFFLSMNMTSEVPDTPRSPEGNTEGPGTASSELLGGQCGHGHEVTAAGSALEATLVIR